MIFTIAGSNSSESINQEVAKEIAKELNCFYYDSRRIDIPVYNRDFNIVSEISNLYNLICEYERIVFVVPEYNGSIPSFFKNIVDELSVYEQKFLANKEIFIVCTTPGKRAGVSVRKITTEMFTHFSGTVISNYGIGEYESLEQSSDKIRAICEDIKLHII